MMKTAKWLLLIFGLLIAGAALLTGVIVTAFWRALNNLNFR